MKHVAFPICKTYDKTYIHLCFGDWMACFWVILVMNQICLKIIYNLFCLTMKAAAQRFCASVECWNKAQRKFKLDYYIEESNQPNEGCHYQLQNDKMYPFFVGFFFGFELLSTRVSFFHWCEILVSHCDTIFLFQHAFTLPFIAMFNFMDNSKFMTIVHGKYFDFVFLNLLQSYFTKITYRYLFSTRHLSEVYVFVFCQFFLTWINFWWIFDKFLNEFLMMFTLNFEYWWNH